MVRFVLIYARAAVRYGHPHGCGHVDRDRRDAQCARAPPRCELFIAYKTILNRNEGKLGFSLVNESAPYRKKDRIYRGDVPLPTETHFLRACTSARLVNASQTRKS